MDNKDYELIGRALTTYVAQHMELNIDCTDVRTFYDVACIVLHELREQERNDNKCTFVVNNVDAKEIEKTMKELLEDSRRKMRCVKGI